MPISQNMMRMHQGSHLSMHNNIYDISSLISAFIIYTYVYSAILVQSSRVP
jgi:hypothetical protein